MYPKIDLVIEQLQQHAIYKQSMQFTKIYLPTYLLNINSDTLIKYNNLYDCIFNLLIGRCGKDI